MSETGRTALLVVSDQPRRSAGIETFARALEAGGMTLIRRDNPDRAKLAELIVSVRRDVDCVILAGGDAMMSAGAIALRDTQLPLGVLPLGTGHDLARRLGLPSEPNAAAKVILDGHTRPIDVGSVNGRPFFGAATVGLTLADSRVLRQAALSPLGRLRYPWTALRFAIRTRRFSCILRVGADVHRVKTIQVTIGNGSQYPGGVSPAAGTQAQDGPPAQTHLLEVCSIEPESRWSLPYLSEIFTEADASAVPEIRVARSPVVEVVTRVPQQIIADGEAAAVTPARFSILPAAVSIFVPPPAPVTHQAEPQPMPTEAHR